MFALALFQPWLLPGFMRWSWRGVHLFPRYSLCGSELTSAPSFNCGSLSLLASQKWVFDTRATPLSALWAFFYYRKYVSSPYPRVWSSICLSIWVYFATRIVWWSDTGIPSQLIAASGTTIIVSTVVSALPFLFGPFEYSRSVQVYMVFVREPKCEYRECAWVLHERAYWAIEGWVRQLRSPVCRRHPSVLKRDRCWRHVGRSS